MGFNFYLAGGLFLRNYTNLPWPVKSYFIPCGFSQEERHALLRKVWAQKEEGRATGMLPIGKMIPLQ